jgi:hypothetical protein
MKLEVRPFGGSLGVILGYGVTVIVHGSPLATSAFDAGGGRRDRIGIN